MEDRHMTRTLSRSGGWLLVFVGMIGADCAWAQVPPVNPQFGMTGLAAGQTLRLNVVAFPPNPCVATIGFLNRDGVAPASNPSKTVSLAPGQSDFVDLTADALGILAGGRREFQPVVSVAQSSDPSVPNMCGASVEVFTSATGATQVATSAPETAVANVAPQFGMVAIALGQTLRLNVVAWPPDPCVAVIGFLTATGAPSPIQNKVVSLDPNHADFIDLHADMLGLQAGERAELQPVVTLLPSASGLSACQADVEVFATATGRTRILLNPQPLPPRKTPQ
jgi:hypothetical protein